MTRHSVYKKFKKRPNYIYSILADGTCTLGAILMLGMHVLLFVYLYLGY